MRSMDPGRMRRLVLVVGIAILSAVTLVMSARGVDRVEVIATLLFIPIFVGLVLGRLAGGLGTAVVAAAVYAALRYPAIEAVGVDRFAGLLLSRTIGYIIFGAVGGWATQALEASLTKLDLYDQIDDDTGLYNARALVQELDLEQARSKRYKTIFSVSLVTFPVSGLKDLRARQRRRILRGLGEILKKSVRTMDRVAYANDDHLHRFALVLPETEAGGNEILTSRLTAGVADYLRDQGVDMPAEAVSGEAITFPDDPEGFDRVRGVFQEIARRLFPEEATHDHPIEAPQTGVV